MMKQLPPLTVQCRYCPARITLNHDSPEARAAGADPHQQMRRHIAAAHGMVDIANHARKLGWLIDSLFFTSDDELRFKAHLYKLIDYYLEGPGLQPADAPAAGGDPR